MFKHRNDLKQQNHRGNAPLTRANIIFRCEISSNVGPVERVSTSGNLHKTSVRKVQRCLFTNRLRFSKLFDDISLMLNVRRLCGIVDSLISAGKVCDCVISAWC